jgi:micrococcal nuclease
MQTRRLTALTGILTLALAILLPDSGLAANARLWYVVDGDTIRLRSEKYLRLIGVDAPETTECGGRASTRALNRRLKGRLRVVRPRGYENTDRYGRLLRYVHDFAKDANRAVIRRGWSQHYDAFTHPRQARYQRAENTARRANRGLWRRCW